MIGHPRRVLVVALLLVVALGLLGSGVAGRLKPASLTIPGTASAKAGETLRRGFGNSSPFAILLSGPPRAIDRQGPALIRALQRDPRVATLSPWEGGPLRRLRPDPRHALVLVNFRTDLDRAVRDAVPRLERILRNRVHPPVRAVQSGFASVSRALQDESIKASERGELIALPILLIVLLLVFRSPIAAAIPLGFGAATVAASRGLLYLLASTVDVDAFALTVCTMMGLALGVDYALLMVSRFREELANGVGPAEAARATRRTAGRTTRFAGATLLLSMLVALLIVPGSLLASLAGTLAIVVAFSVLISVTVVPALLAWIGPDINRWRIGRPPGERSRLMAYVRAALRRPALAAGAIGAIVLVLAAPALALKTGAPGPDQLSPGDPARRDIERIYHAIGPGWNAPFQIVAATRNGPITTRSRLAALARAQRRISALPGVQEVIGPGRIVRRAASLQKAGNNLLAARSGGGALGQLGSVGRRLGLATKGVSRLREGLAQASAGAGLLGRGSTRAAAGAVQLSRGLAAAGAGSRRAHGALATLSSGAGRLAGAQQRASFGSLQLKAALAAMAPNLRRNGLRRSRQVQRSLSEESNVALPQLIEPAVATEAQLKAALSHLQAMSTGRSDPEYAPALEALGRASGALEGSDPLDGEPYASGYAGLPSGLSGLQTHLLSDFAEARQVSSWLSTSISQLKKLTAGARRLSLGLSKAAAGGGRLADGSARLKRASGSLADGLAHLLSGQQALAGGVSRLGGGARALRERLAEGATRSAPLQSGLGRASTQLIGNDEQLQKRLSGIHRASPGLFDSGYFLLSALDGAPRRRRESAEGAIDLRRGGQIASIFVISKYNFDTPGSVALNHRLDSLASGLGRGVGISAGVAGGAAQLNEYGKVARDRFPVLVVAIAFATFLALLVVLRSVPLAAIAVLLNLATVAVAFGALTLLFHVPADLPLGGHTYVDAVGATMIFGIVFGLSIDYAVFLLSRMKECHDDGGSNERAVEFGLEKTARVITGAAAIMMAVFIAFAGAPIATVSQLGAGLTVAVLLDATVVRIVLLPALMLLMGERVWWLPRSLERALPRLSV
jgi:RND superfamily putative drug exporter